MAVGLLVGMIAGCDEQSRVDRDAPIRIDGTAVAATGAPLADRPVRLGFGIGTGDGLSAVLTLGLACVGGGCTGKVFDATTDADGRYTFDLKGKDTQSNFGEALSTLASVSAAPDGNQVSGAAASARFKVQSETVVLPPLELVDPGLSLTADDAVAAQWSTPKAGPFTLTFETANPTPVWRVATPDQSVSIDPRILEDSTGRVVVSGTPQDVAIAGAESATITWRSPGIGYASEAGAPPSRGRPCRYTDAAGSVAVDTPSCGVTDGNFDTTAPAPSLCPSPPGSDTTTAPCPQPAWVVVDLGESVPAELAVVRGCQGGCAVEVSPDGTTFTPAGAAPDDFGVVPLDGQPVTAIRTSVGTNAGSLREISLWGPPPDQPPLRSLDASGAEDLRKPFGIPGSDRRIPGWLLVLAVAVAAVVLLATGFAAGRYLRRPRSGLSPPPL